MEKLSELGDRLTELMVNNDVKSEYLAKAIGISGPVIRAWCKGDQNVQLKSMLKIADYFQCSLEFLVGRTDNQLDYIPKPCPSFGTRIRILLKKYGITTYKINKDTRIKYNHFFKWDHGSDPQLSSLLELSSYLKITLDYLVGREDD